MRRLAELKDKRDKIDAAASRYEALTEARDRAHEQYEAAIKTGTDVLSRDDAIRRHIDALPRLARLFSLREQMQPLVALPIAPAGWHSLLPALRDELITLGERDKALGQKRAELYTALQNIVVDEAACSVAGQLDRLNGLNGRYVTADNDLPIRKLEVRAADTRIAGILAESVARRLAGGAVAGLAGLGLSQGGFTETQAGAANLTVGSQGLTSIQSVLAARAERRFPLGETKAVVPTARIGWLHEFADTVGTATASFAGVGTPFSAQSAPIGRDAALIGLGATLQTGGPVSRLQRRLRAERQCTDHHRRRQREVVKRPDAPPSQAGMRLFLPAVKHAGRSSWQWNLR